MLAVARHVEYGTALHMLARNPSAFTSSGPAGRLKSFISLGKFQYILYAYPAVLFQVT